MGNEKSLPSIAFWVGGFHPVFSGYGVVVRQWAKALVARGCRVTVLTWREPGLAWTEELEGYTIIRLPKLESRLLTNILALIYFTLLVPTRLRHVQVYNLSIGRWLTWLAPSIVHLFGRKCLFHHLLYNSDNPSQTLRERWGRLKLRLFSGYDAFISMSPQLFEDSKAHFPDRPCYMIPQGIDADFFRPPRDKVEKAALREALELPEDRFVIAFAGALIHRKGGDILLRAAAELKERRPEILLIMVGPSSDEELPEPEMIEFAREMRRFIRDEGLSDLVRLWGFIPLEKLRDLMMAADAFAFPTRMEGMPGVLVEAMACGLPCASSRLEGITDVMISSGEDGLLIDDPGEWSAVLERLIGDEELRDRLGQAARRTVLDRFGFDAVLESLLEVNRSLVAGED